MSKDSVVNEFQSSGPIRPLRWVPTLLADDSVDSKEALRILTSAGIHPRVTVGNLRPGQARPLVLYRGATYQGLDQIKDLISHLIYLSGHSPSSQEFQQGAA